jgi:hypothetical protein
MIEFGIVSVSLDSLGYDVLLELTEFVKVRH